VPTASLVAAKANTGTLGEAFASADDFDDLIAALERGGVQDSTVDDDSTPESLHQGVVPEVSHVAKDKDAQSQGQQSQLEASAASAHSGFEPAEQVTKMEGAAQLCVHTSTERTFLRLFLISTGVLARIPAAQVIQFESRLYSKLRGLSLSKAASLTGRDAPEKGVSGHDFLRFARMEAAPLGNFGYGDAHTLLAKAEKDPWQLVQGQDVNSAFSMLHDFTHAYCELFIE
jgi:hypothetical protein